MHILVEGIERENRTVVAGHLVKRLGCAVKDLAVNGNLIVGELKSVNITTVALVRIRIIVHSPAVLSANEYFLSLLQGLGKTCCSRIVKYVLLIFQTRLEGQGHNCHCEQSSNNSVEILCHNRPIYLISREVRSTMPLTTSS